MATKQVQSFEEYAYNLPLAESSVIDINSTIAFLAEYQSTLDSEGHTFKRVNFSDVFGQFAEKKGLLKKDEVDSLLDGKYLAVSEEAMGKCVSFDTVYSTNDSANRGVYFNAGITLSFDPSNSWMGWGEFNPSLYGDVSSYSINCNVCNGTFSMQKVYVDDLWVKNLHTADSFSSSSSSEMETATITNLTTDTLTPKDSCGLVHVNGGISFDSDVYGIFKFDNNTSHYSFDNGLFISGDNSISFYGGYGGGSDAKIFYGEGSFLVFNRGIWFQPAEDSPTQYLMAGNMSANEVFNTNGGLTEVYSKADADSKFLTKEISDSVNIDGSINMSGDWTYINNVFGITFADRDPNQRYLVANNQKDYEVFNTNGGFVNVYSQTEIDDKIKALEARIAALESK